MDSIVPKYRYSRRNSVARKRRKNTYETNNLAETIIKQVFFSVLILLMVVIVKNVDIPVTNYVAGKIQEAATHDINLESLYEKAINLLNDVKGIDFLKSRDDGIEAENDAVPVSSAIPVFNEGQKEIYGENYCVGEEFISPLKGTLGSEFGNRKHPVKNTLEFHQGIDIECNGGDLIKAALSGVVVEIGSSPSYGKYLRLSHKPDLETVYAHCSDFNVKEGQQVKQGDVIANVEDTGIVTGTHLHFEIWKDGKPVNPVDYIEVSKR